MTLITKESVENPYQFVLEKNIEEFERLSFSIYLDVSEASKAFPPLNTMNLFLDNEYQVSEGVYDFLHDNFSDILEAHNVHEGKKETWSDETWDDVDIDLTEGISYLQKAFVDDIYTHWDRHQLVFINEHRTVTEGIEIANNSIQEVW